MKYIRILKQGTDILDEKLNLPQKSSVANMKFANLCIQYKGGDGQSCTKKSKFSHHHLCTGCKAL